MPNWFLTYADLKTIQSKLMTEWYFRGQDRIPKHGFIYKERLYKLYISSKKDIEIIDKPFRAVTPWLRGKTTSGPLVF